VPSPSPEWLAGALAQDDARNEGLNAGAREVRDYLEAAARLHPEHGQAELAAGIAWVCTAGTSFRFRLRLARRILFGR
jgi:hypothetical protein